MQGITVSVCLKRQVVSSLKTRVKQAAKWFLGHSGATSLAVRWRRRGGGLWTLTYHHVHDTSRLNPPFDVDPGTSPEAFDKQLAYLRRHFQFIDGSALRDHFVLGAPLPENACLITFDDAYADVLPYADKVLTKYEAHAVMFVPTGFIETKRTYWWDTLLWACFDGCRDQLQAGDWNVLLNSEDDRLAAYIDGVKYFRRADVDQRQLFVDDLSGIVVPERPECARMTWEQLRRLDRRRWTIGAHTIDHPVMSDLPYVEQLRQWQFSRDELETRLDEEIWCAAFPFGEPELMDDISGRAVADAGLRACFTQRAGIYQEGDNPFCVPRFGIAPRDDFALKLAGIYDSSLVRRCLGVS